MTKKKEREASQIDFDYTQAEKFNKIVTTKLEYANFEVQTASLSSRPSSKPLANELRFPKKLQTRQLLKRSAAPPSNPKKLKPSTPV